MYRTFGKRIFDVALAAISLALLSPLWLAIVLVLRVFDGPPTLFRQERVGRDCRHFEMLKFRSMALGSGNVASADAEALQVTPVGRLIRRTNMDELPQLINILKGDMSVVGPRPALPSQVDLIQARKELHVIALSPGLTGCAQVNSFDGMSDREKAEWDSRYSSCVTFVGDLTIILRTFSYLLKRPPVY